MASTGAPQDEYCLVKFRIRFETKWGECLILLGSAPEIGSWQLGRAVRLNWSEDHIWEANVKFKVPTEFEYKYAVVNVDFLSLRWEVGQNRRLQLKSVPPFRIDCYDMWETPHIDPLSALAEDLRTALLTKMFRPELPAASWGPTKQPPSPSPSSFSHSSSDSSSSSSSFSSSSSSHSSFTSDTKPESLASKVVSSSSSVSSPISVAKEVGSAKKSSVPANVTQRTVQLVLLRHCETEWEEARFCGWTDIPLSLKGRSDAQSVARSLAHAGLTFDIAFTSVLRRAILTMWIILEEMRLMWIPTSQEWQLNERMYGALQGLSKSETARKEGEDTVRIWRRSYDTPPPPMSKDDNRYKEMVRASFTASIPAKSIPVTESFKDCFARIMPFYYSSIEPAMRQGKKPLIVAHGTTLRALCMHLESFTPQEVEELNIPTGIPLVYELDVDTLTPRRRYYLSDAETVKQAMERVANQAKPKPH